MFTPSPVGNSETAYRNLRDSFMKLRREYAELEVAYAKILSERASDIVSKPCICCGRELEWYCPVCDG